MIFAYLILTMEVWIQRRFRTSNANPNRAAFSTNTTWYPRAERSSKTGKVFGCALPC